MSCRVKRVVDREGVLALAREALDPRVVVALILLDRLAEDRRIRGDAVDRPGVDEGFQPAGPDHLVRDAVQPHGLAAGGRYAIGALMGSPSSAAWYYDADSLS